MRRDDVRFAVAAREDGLRRVRRLTFRIGAAAVACSTAIAVAFSHLSGSAAASGQAPGTGSGQAAGSGGSSSSGGSQSGGNPAGSGTQQGGTQQGGGSLQVPAQNVAPAQGLPREFRGAHDRGGRHGAGRRLAGRRPAAPGRARGDRGDVVHPAVVHHPGHRRGRAGAADHRDGPGGCW